MALEIARAGAGNSSARLVVLAFHGDDVRNVVKGRMHYLATVDGLAETMALKFGGVHNVASVALRPKEGDPWKRGKALKEAARHVAQLSPGVPRHLVAFSRGAVALSACCSDLAEDPSARGALGGPVKGVHYIDAGVSPGPGAHPEYGAAIKIGEFLKEYGAIARVEGTPRQWEDEKRNWLRQEKDNFVKGLKEGGADVTEEEHFKGESPSMEQHLRAIDAFSGAP